MRTDQDAAEMLGQNIEKVINELREAWRMLNDIAASPHGSMYSHDQAERKFGDGMYRLLSMLQIERAAALRRQPGTWQDISTAPIDQRAVLACHENNRTGTTGFQVTWRVAVDSPEYVHRGMERGATWKPTHWMPLPAAPASLKE